MSTPQHTELDERYATDMNRLYIIAVVTTHHYSFYVYSSRSHTLSDHLLLGIMTHGTESVKSIMQLGTGSAGRGSSLAKAKAMLPKQLYSCKGVHCSLSFTKSMRSSSIHTAAHAGKSHFLLHQCTSHSSPRASFDAGPKMVHPHDMCGCTNRSPGGGERRTGS